MAVPTKQEFLSYFDLQFQIPKDIGAEIDQFRNPTNKQIFEICELLDQVELKRQKNILAADVRKWLENQANYKKALKTITFKKRPPEFSDVLDYKKYRADQILKKWDKTLWSEENHYSSNPNRPPKISQSAVRLNSKLRLEPFQSFYGPYKSEALHFGLVGCLYDYFYSDRAGEMLHLKVTGNKLLNEIKGNLRDLASLSVLDEFIYADDWLKYWPLFGHGTFNIYKLASKFEVLKINIPFERNDKTLKERVLIYDLSRVFKRYFRVNKSNAIFYLLMLEGISNNIEKRNIEKMLSKWSRQ